MELKPYLHNAKYYETDQMAIVHHSNYIRWFEEARVDWMSQMGLPLTELEANGIVIPVVSVSAKYRTMVRFGEDVFVRVWLTQYNGVRFVFRYEITDAATGVLRTTGESEHCLMDEQDRIVNLKHRNPALHQRLLGLVETPTGGQSR